MRRTVEVRIPQDDPGRDRGKLFIITEMPSGAAEEWAMRAILVAANSGADVSAAIGALGVTPQAGMQGVAVVGFETLIRGAEWRVVKPLLDEMMTCVTFVPDPGRPEVSRPLMTDDDIEEVKTRLLLRTEWFKLHVGPLQAGVLQK